MAYFWLHALHLIFYYNNCDSPCPRPYTTAYVVQLDNYTLSQSGRSNTKFPVLFIHVNLMRSTSTIRHRENATGTECDRYLCLTIVFFSHGTKSVVVVIHTHTCWQQTVKTLWPTTMIGLRLPYVNTWTMFTYHFLCLYQICAHLQFHQRNQLSRF